MTRRWLAMCCGVLLSTLSAAVETHAGTITGKVTASGVQDARDVVVYIDRIEGAEFPAPATPAELRQVNKEFIPHVLPILKGGSVSFSNSDGILHNVHLYQGRRSLFNLATPAGAKPITKRFQEPGEVAVLCDIHPEMSAYILVLETPYAAVTAEDGHYTIADVPPGTYTLNTWHEKLKPVATAVTVEGESTVEVNVKLK
ncbi:MAG: carboxypeptidase regulatory-like domain-containing protein [Candidatus Omnitrophica bacterium]|nr:carboxypeptidase regulatory-like domain-containing protein [Candidatus Omnitrophota bacterium]